jgi:tRNA (cytidine56-2'-O)-methyltransferase
MARIEILRLGHRLPRDERISTHVALVARAFGAGGVIYTGQHDAGLESSVSRICENWGGRTPDGGPFSIRHEKSAVSVIKAKKKEGFAIAHLTMYGIPLMQAMPQMRRHERLLVIVGSEQVPGEIYALADHNVSVTGQPHSEVAALAIALDRLVEGRELVASSGSGNPGAEAGGFDFGGRIRIIPSPKGKRIIEDGGKK